MPIMLVSDYEALGKVGRKAMLEQECIDWIDECEWIERINPGQLGDRYLEDTYQLKDGAPEDIKKEWEELCAVFRIAG